MKYMKIFKVMALIINAFIFFGCTQINNSKPNYRIFKKAIYKSKGIKVAAYLDYKIMKYTNFMDNNSDTQVITLFLKFERTKNNRLYIIERSLGSLSLLMRSLVWYQTNASKMIVFMGATPECMKDNEDFVFSEYNKNSVFLNGKESAKKIFHMFYTGGVDISVASFSKFGDMNMEKEELTKVKKLIVKIEYFDNPNFLVNNGFKTIGEINFYARLYNSYYPPIGKNGEPNWSLWKDVDSKLLKKQKMYYKKSRKLYKLIKDNRKILRFEFDVDFSEEFIKNRILDFRTKGK